MSTYDVVIVCTMIYIGEPSYIIWPMCHIVILCILGSACPAYVRVLVKWSEDQNSKNILNILIIIKKLAVKPTPQ